MSDMTVKCNEHPRLLINWDQLTPKEQKDFDYLDQHNQPEASFVRYKGVVYDLGEFMTVTPVNANAQREGWKGFDGYHSDSFFSGVLVRYCKDNDDYVVMATYMS